MTLERARNGFAFAGMAVAVAGVALNSTLVVWIAIAILGGAVVLRVMIRARARAAESDPPA